ncbi:hypothetical protein LHYA1_G005486 [Lachnellula hyalina]|uniref:BZIP domain-containing protein n=1 Tax=Lachnellula hyalina TaxID=1316788 RepID=A0A8H8QZY5_9HELO|nr:uncharacterized protein LHYA1_G005486 [Lachnellula hyalina]TVY26012.1 hypothetical protein LHYA1_G005486 [Lachnellula hyalina]
MSLQKFVNPAGIVVRPMLDRPEIHAREEDWTGITSTAMRRKLQNRLNQRAKRRRAQARPQESAATGEMEEGYDISMEVTLIQRSGRGSNICMEPRKRKWVISASDFASFLHPKTTLSLDHKLLTLMHFNLVRALTRITLLLGVDPDDMHLDIESPFHSTASSLSISELPPSLRPTEMQLTVPHHPEIDIFPFPRIRDNMIAAIDVLDDMELCQDIAFGVDDRSGERRGVDQGDCAEIDHSRRTGLIVWGDPWLQSSWEVDQEFAKKYKGLFEGCEELIRSTNFWREKRGESPLDMRQ